MNYKLLNNSDDYRSLIGEELLVFSDKNKFNKLKSNNDSRIKDAEYFLKILRKQNNKKINKFLWELYAYGFNINNEEIQNNNNLTNKEKDKIELLKLLLGTAYWY